MSVAAAAGLTMASDRRSLGMMPWKSDRWLLSAGRTDQRILTDASTLETLQSRIFPGNRGYVSSNRQCTESALRAAPVSGMHGTPKCMRCSRLAIHYTNDFRNAPSVFRDTATRAYGTIRRFGNLSLFCPSGFFDSLGLECVPSPK